LFYCVRSVNFWGLKVAEETKTAVSISIGMVWKEARALLAVQEVMQTHGACMLGRNNDC
jgi:hypothetical protein